MLLGEPGQIYLAVGTLILVYGADGSAKSTLTVDAIASLWFLRDFVTAQTPEYVEPADAPPTQ